MNHDALKEHQRNELEHQRVQLSQRVHWAPIWLKRPNWVEGPDLFVLRNTAAPIGIAYGRTYVGVRNH